MRPWFACLALSFAWAPLAADEPSAVVEVSVTAPTVTRIDSVPVADRGAAVEDHATAFRSSRLEAKATSTTPASSTTASSTPTRRAGRASSPTTPIAR